MTNRFPSINHSDKLVYVFDSSHRFASGLGSGYGICPALRHYDTYGDGETQHSPTAAVAPEQLVDCLFSLAQAMLNDKELCDAVSGELRLARPEDSKLAFARTVKFKDSGKDRYYSISLQKITTADKYNDKRYERIESRHDGDIDSVFGVLWQSYYSPFNSFCLMNAIRRSYPSYLPPTAKLLKWIVTDAGAERLDAAYGACLAVLDARDAFDRAERSVSCYVAQLAHEREQAAQATSQEVA